jgi:hypothetical protein
MTAIEIKKEFDRLALLFNSLEKVDRYRIGHRLGGLITRYYNLTGVRLVKPPRKRVRPANKSSYRKKE